MSFGARSAHGVLMLVKPKRKRKWEDQPEACAPGPAKYPRSDGTLASVPDALMDADAAPHAGPGQAVAAAAAAGQQQGQVRCASCNQLGHSRRTNRACPHYVRPDNRGPLQLGADGHELVTFRRTTRIGLNALLRAPGEFQPDNRENLRNTILEYVNRMTLISVEATRALHGYALHMLAQNTPFPSLAYNNGVMRQFFSGVLRSRADQPLVRNSVNNPTVENYLNRQYTALRPAGLPWNDGFRLADHISYAAHLHETNCKNHFTTLFPNKLASWIACQMDREFTRNQINVTFARLKLFAW